MGKSQRRARLGKGHAQRQRADNDEMLGPTREQEARAVYAVEASPDDAGRFDLRKKRMRRVPVIDTMLTRGELTDAEHRRLAHYRDQAVIAERSLTRSCLAERSGSGGGDASPSAAVVSAMIATGRIERDLGSLMDIARAVCVDDKSLSQWCIEKHGGRERYDGKGRFVAVVPVREVEVLRIARQQLRYAAGAIVV